MAEVCLVQRYTGGYLVSARTALPQKSSHSHRALARCKRCESPGKPFQRFLVISLRKPLKRLLNYSPAYTRLKPGENERRLLRQSRYKQYFHCQSVDCIVRNAITFH